MRKKITIKGKEFRLIDHPKYPFLAPYYISENGIVVRALKESYKEMNAHRMGHRKAEGAESGLFVRLSGEHKNASLSVGQLVLIAWDRKPKEGEIAIHKKGLKDNLSNLFWGTRADQSAISMKNPENFKRVSNIHSFSKVTRRLPDSVVSQIKQMNRDKVPVRAIAAMLEISLSVAYKYL